MLSHYRLIEKIGEGGMGEVYVAEDTRLKRRIALKVLPSEMVADPDRRARFEREAQTVARLNHPNIVTLHSIEEANTSRGPVHFITMELIEGSTLSQLLTGSGLGLERLLEIAIPLADAVATAHRAGITHRDLKPQNVMIGSDGRVKVLDFGLAKLAPAVSELPINSELVTEMKTQEGVILGTVPYMSPEQAQGGKVNHSSDIFSLGVILYEMASGQRPFKGDTAIGLLSSILKDDPPPVDGLPEGLSAILRKCLAKDPADRYQDGGTLLQEISNIKSTEARVADKPLGGLAKAGLDAGANVADSLRRPGGPPQQMPLVRSIAVLPFTNLSSDPEDGYFADGLTDEIITDLSRIRDLQVASSPSAFRFKGTEKSIREIATELNVRHILVGRVRKSGRKVRMTAQLVDASNDRTLWADKYTADLEQVFEAQEQVSQAIAQALKVELTGGVRAPNAEAAEAYLKGRHFLRQATGDGLEKALDCFEQATKSDPYYAPAYARIADTLVWMAAGWVAMPAREAMPRARAAAERALQLDPNLVEAHIAMGAVATYSDWDPHAAERSFQQALRLRPNDAGALYWSTHPLMWLDTRFDEALARVRRASQLSPVDPWIQLWHSWVHQFSRDFDAGTERARHLVALEPLWSQGHYGLGICLALTGRLAEARASLHRGIDLGGRAVQYVAWLGATHALSGRDSEAQKCLAELESHEHRGSNVAAWKLVVHSGLGNADQVMQLLEEAFQERSVSLVFHLTHPTVDCVREDSRFVDLLHRMKLDHLVGYRPDPAWKPLPSWREP
jgi:serine/threonine-protein kinase